MENKYDFSIMRKHVVLGIPVLDNQHTHLMRITNNLHLACLSDSKNANYRFKQAVRETVDFVRLHFKTEEKLMTLSGFPGYRDHEKEHRDFMWEILNRSEQFQKSEEYIPQNFVQFFRDWVEAHIGCCDKAFADFFLTMKQNDKLRMVLAGDMQLSAQPA